MDKHNFYAVIPATVLWDNTLRGDEKILYAHISALADKEGYCWASNQYLADLFGVHRDTISEWINHLKERHHIETSIEKNHARKIYIAKGVRRNHLGGLGGNTEGGSVKTPIYKIQSIITEDKEAPASISLKVEQDSSEPQTLESYLRAGGYTEVEFYAGEEEGEVVGWKHPRRKRPYTQSEVEKLHRDASKTLKKAPRTHENFNHDTWLMSLKNSSYKPERIVALIWHKKGYRFENYAQWRAQMDKDAVYAKKLVGYSGEQIAEAIRRCEEEAAKAGYDWGASTVWKKIAQVTV